MLRLLCGGVFGVVPVVNAYECCNCLYMFHESVYSLCVLYVLYLRACVNVLYRFVYMCIRCECLIVFVYVLYILYMFYCCTTHSIWQTCR